VTVVVSVLFLALLSFFPSTFFLLVSQQSSTTGTHSKRSNPPTLVPLTHFSSLFFFYSHEEDSQASIVPVQDVEALEEEIRMRDEEIASNLTRVRPHTDNGYLDRQFIGTYTLPMELRDAITRTLSHYPRKQLRENAAKLSAQLRARTRVSPEELDSGVVPVEDREPVVYNEGAAQAYVAYRLPAVFACTSRVFTELALHNDRFAPRTMLDFGSGPG
jgi:Mitochondrial small ribosomal subunit Rsm22